VRAACDNQKVRLGGVGRGGRGGDMYDPTSSWQGDLGVAWHAAAVSSRITIVLLVTT